LHIARWAAQDRVYVAAKHAVQKKRHALGLDGFDAIEELPGERSFLPL
jgi:hypothetical protein